MKAFIGLLLNFQSGQHLIIPEQSRVEINEHLKIARGKLQLIPNKMFEELVMDLYEEVDRREMETSKKIEYPLHNSFTQLRSF